MLCLSRKTGQKIVIGKCVVVEVLMVKNGKVRLGISAPADVSVDREEIHDSKLIALRQRDAASTKDASPPR